MGAGQWVICLGNADSQISADTERLLDVGFNHVRFFDPHHWAAVILTGSFTAIVDGDRDALSLGYQGRWVYRTHEGAISALRKWDGESQPEGWITSKPTKTITIWP